MNASRLDQITTRYGGLRVAVLGDFCLDRYLEIDPARQETSIETGLPVHNVVNVRAQAGGAGTIVNNLAALGVGTILPLGFAGLDGEGYELLHALEKLDGVRLTHFIRTDQRRTFTYCKPLIVVPNSSPAELNRLDSKNWTTTPFPLQDLLVERLETVAREVDALIVLDQVDVPETGVVTDRVRDALHVLLKRWPKLLILADSRRGLCGFPPVGFKMNAAELARLSGGTSHGVQAVMETAATVARRNQNLVFVTLAERGMVGAVASGQTEHVPALPVRGEIDIVGAGDAVTANLVAALAAGADLRESLEIAAAAASIVIHQLGTTGTASVRHIRELLKPVATESE